jgi:hypothetical protein
MIGGQSEYSNGSVVLLSADILLTLHLSLHQTAHLTPGSLYPFSMSISPPDDRS